MSDLNLRIAISIHALREEGDAGPAFPRCRPAISIHALREEGDAAKSMWNAQPAEFLSTPSARRATPPGQVQQIRHVDFYPRPPRGGRRQQKQQRPNNEQFLSTPSARRATRGSMFHSKRGKLFLSTPPAGGAPPPAGAGPAERLFLFHAPPPAWGATGPGQRQGGRAEFLSTPSARRATFIRRLAGACVKNFYPRPPRGGRR